MNAAERSRAAASQADAGYEAYAQLVRMLLPSSGEMAIYTPEGELGWCRGGVERPEFRALIDEIKRDPAALDANVAELRSIGQGMTALLASFNDDGGQALAILLVELGDARSEAASAMAVSLTRPVLACLRWQLLTQRSGARLRVSGLPTGADTRLRFMLDIGEIRRDSESAIRQMLEACVRHLDCLSVVLWLPERDLIELAETPALTDEATRARIAGTHKHLLAWARHNRKSMVVNRIDSAQEQYKILSCPVGERAEGPPGLLALFRSAGGPNFELNDVRLIEYLSRRVHEILEPSPAGPGPQAATDE
jgi:hypothetical protein